MAQFLAIVVVLVSLQGCDGEDASSSDGPDLTGLCEDTGSLLDRIRERRGGADLLDNVKVADALTSMDPMAPDPGALVRGSAIDVIQTHMDRAVRNSVRDDIYLLLLRYELGRTCLTPAEVRFWKIMLNEFRSVDPQSARLEGRFPDPVSDYRSPTFIVSGERFTGSSTEAREFRRKRGGGDCSEDGWDVAAFPAASAKAGRDEYRTAEHLIRSLSSPVLGVFEGWVGYCGYNPTYPVVLVWSDDGVLASCRQDGCHDIGIQDAPRFRTLEGVS